MKLYTFACLGALAFGLGCQSAVSPDTNTETTAASESSQPADNTGVAENSGQESEEIAIEKAKRISLEDAKKDFDNGSAVFVDTRSKVFYDNEHVKGSINVPSNDFENTYKELPKDKKIIAYCS